MKTCLGCGGEIKPTNNAQKRCPDCAKEACRASARKYRAKKRAERGEPPLTDCIECIDCGVEIKRMGGGHKRCLGCAKKVKRERATTAYAQSGQAGRDLRATYYYENRKTASRRRAMHAAENPGLRREGRRREKDRDDAIEANRAKFHWTAAEDAVVMSWTEGLRELGAALGRTRGSVRTRRQKLRKRAAEQSTSNEGVKP